MLLETMYTGSVVKLTHSSNRRCKYALLLLVQCTRFSHAFMTIFRIMRLGLLSVFGQAFPLASNMKGTTSLPLVLCAHKDISCRSNLSPLLFLFNRSMRMKSLLACARLVVADELLLEADMALLSINYLPNNSPLIQDWRKTSRL